jgi:phospholipase/carboxylesterase
VSNGRPLAVLALALAPLGCGRDAPPEPAPEVPATGAEPARATGTPEAAGVPYMERITGGAAAGDVLPLVVAVHGLGDRPESFVSLFASLRARARLVVPYGEPWRDGYAWFPAGSLDDPQKLAEGTSRAAGRLAAMMAVLVRERPTSGKPIVTGFSQGGMLAFTLAVQHPEAVSAAFPVGGLLAPPLFPDAWPPGKEQPVIVAFHGADDDRVPVGGARRTVQRLREIGLPAELHEYPGVRHTVSDAEREELMRAITAAVARATR